MKTIYNLPLLLILTTNVLLAQTEIESNDTYGEATVINSLGALTGTTDADWQGDMWKLNFAPGNYSLNWTGDGCTRVRIVEYNSTYNPTIEEANNTPGSSSTCPPSGPFECHQIDNLGDLSASGPQSFTIVSGNHYYLFLNPHNCTGENYSIELNTLTSVSEINEIDNGLLLYPNPTTGIFTLESEYLDTHTKIQVLDLMGKILIEKSLLSNSISLDISDLSNGAYLIIASNNNESRIMKLFKQ